MMFVQALKTLALVILLLNLKVSLLSPAGMPDADLRFLVLAIRKQPSAVCLTSPRSGTFAYFNTLYELACIAAF